MIRLSNDALSSARQIAEAGKSEIRIGTNLLFKLRKLPELWAEAIGLMPDLKIEDLKDQNLVMPVKDISDVLDAFRNEIEPLSPSTNFIESRYYGLDTFALCELNPYILISQKVYEDIHPDLVSIPLEASYSILYGLISSKRPSDATVRFMDSVKTLME